jgi:hypothetical protein
LSRIEQTRNNYERRGVILMKTKLKEKKMKLHFEKMKKVMKEIKKEINDEDLRLKAFYHLSQYFTLKCELNLETKSDIEITMLDDRLLQNVSVDRFLTFFPIAKKYNKKGDTVPVSRDYFITKKKLKKEQKIYDVQKFLWDTYCNQISDYIVNKGCLLLNSIKNEKDLKYRGLFDIRALSHFFKKEKEYLK